jgi:hypothetical protein
VTTSLQHQFDTTAKVFEFVHHDEGTWDDSFEITFFKEKDYSSDKIIKELYIGQYVFAELKPLVSFSSVFPVQFFVNKCSIESEDTRFSFNLIENGCTADLVHTEVHSEGPYQKEKLRFRCSFQILFSYLVIFRNR